MLFKDRHDAAKQLIPALKKYRNTPAVVLAIPRGAVPMGYDVAVALNLPLDILLTKKIGHPQNPELAVGAVSLYGIIVDKHYHLDDEYIEKETQRIRNTLAERYKKFMANGNPVDLKNKTAILIDDGIATGNTILSSVELARLNGANRIVVAVPVASVEAVTKLKPKVDELICLHVPDNFMAVGQFYEDFSEVTDEDVIRTLRKQQRDKSKI